MCIRDSTGAVLSDAIDAIRAVKSEEEFDAIRRAQVITDACFEHMLGYIKPCLLYTSRCV